MKQLRLAPSQLFYMALLQTGVLLIAAVLSGAETALTKGSLPESALSPRNAAGRPASLSKSLHCCRDIKGAFVCMCV